MVSQIIVKLLRVQQQNQTTKIIRIWRAFDSKLPQEKIGKWKSGQNSSVSEEGGGGKSEFSERLAGLPSNAMCIAQPNICTPDSNPYSAGMYVLIHVRLFYQGWRTFDPKNEVANSPR